MSYIRCEFQIGVFDNNGYKLPIVLYASPFLALERARVEIPYLVRRLAIEVQKFKSVCNYISRESWTTRNVLWSLVSGRARLFVCVCVSVCLSVRSRMPTLLHGPGCNLGSGRGCPPSCALLGGFAIGARVALLWQHNANAKC